MEFPVCARHVALARLAACLAAWLSRDSLARRMGRRCVSCLGLPPTRKVHEMDRQRRLPDWSPSRRHRWGLGDRPFYDSMSVMDGSRGHLRRASPRCRRPPLRSPCSVRRWNPKMVICMSALKLEEKLPACGLSMAALTGREAGFRLCSLQRRSVIGDAGFGGQPFLVQKAGRIIPWHNPTGPVWKKTRIFAISPGERPPAR